MYIGMLDCLSTSNSGLSCNPQHSTVATSALQFHAQPQPHPTVTRNVPIWDSVTRKVEVGILDCLSMSNVAL